MKIYDDFATWRRHRPNSLPAATIAEAERYLSDIRGLMFPAPRQTATKWLATFGACTAGNMSPEDVRMKLKIYADLLEQPEFVYGLDSLKAAARKFKWFPSFAELDEFLNNQGSEYRALDHRLREIANLPTDEEIAAAKAAEEAEKLAKMLSTPAGRIRHQHWDKFSRSGRTLSWKDSWYDLVEALLKLHDEPTVDRMHHEVAAMDWEAPGFSAMGELRARSRAALPISADEAEFNAAFWREAAAKRAQRDQANDATEGDIKE